MQLPQCDPDMQNLQKLYANMLLSKLFLPFQLLMVPSSSLS